MSINHTGQNLIFLISQPRAGSTMLQRILAGHPEIHTTAEPWLMLPLIYTLREQGIRTDYDQSIAVSAVNDFLSSFKDGRHAYQDALRDAAVSMYQLACQSAGKSFFLDKTPRYYLIIEELYQLFPKSKFILLFRHPLAVLHSILQTRVKGDWILLGRYRSDLLVAPHRLLQAQAVLGPSCHTLKYEDFVLDPDEKAAQLFAFLGLEYSSAYLNYGALERPPGKLGDQSTVNNHSQPSSDRSNQWHRLVDDPHTLHFARGYLAELGDQLLYQMGYSAEATRGILNTSDKPDGEIEISWQALFDDDSAYRNRKFYAELALLEHRRFVFAMRNLLNRFRGQ